MCGQYYDYGTIDLCTIKKKYTNTNLPCSNYVYHVEHKECKSVIHGIGQECKNGSSPVV